MNLKDAFWNWVVTHAQTIQYVDMHLACLEMWVEWIPIKPFTMYNWDLLCHVTIIGDLKIV